MLHEAFFCPACLNARTFPASNTKAIAKIVARQVADNRCRKQNPPLGRAARPEMARATRGPMLLRDKFHEKLPFVTSVFSIRIKLCLYTTVLLVGPERMGEGEGGSEGGIRA